MLHVRCYEEHVERSTITHEVFNKTRLTIPGNTNSHIRARACGFTCAGGEEGHVSALKAPEALFRFREHQRGHAGPDTRGDDSRDASGDHVLLQLFRRYAQLGFVAHVDVWNSVAIARYVITGLAISSVKAREG
eukprot:944522-Pyramimonas_sp.AAC.2